MPNKAQTKRLPWVKERAAFEREQNNAHLYNSYKWRKQRRIYLNVNPLCVHCLELGIKTAATVVDHVVRYKEGDDFFDQNNWQPLCERHHNVKSSNESRGMGSKHKNK